MPILREDAKKLITELGSDVIERFDFNSKFLNALWTVDDWTFVIKSHALIETVVTQMLAEHAGDERFTKLMQRLPLSDDEVGKIALAKDLNLLNKSQRRFIRYYSNLRNSLVHRVENINFSLLKYLQNMDAAQKKTWLESVVYFTKSKESQTEWENISLKHPKAGLWFAIFDLVCRCSFVAADKKAKIKLSALSLKASEKLFAEIIVSKPT